MSEDKNNAAAPMWDIAFKAITVLIIPWAVFVTSSIYGFRAFISRGDRFSASDGHRLEKVILEESYKLKQLINTYEKEFSEDFIRKEELDMILDNRDRAK